MTAVAAVPVTAADNRPVAAAGASLLQWAQDCVLWLVALQRRHRERMRLAEMDDAALKDIGLSRCDMLAELRKPRWRR